MLSHLLNINIMKKLINLLLFFWQEKSDTINVKKCIIFSMTLPTCFSRYYYLQINQYGSLWVYTSCYIWGLTKITKIYLEDIVHWTTAIPTYKLFSFGIHNIYNNMPKCLVIFRFQVQILLYVGFILFYDDLFCLIYLLIFYS